MWLQLGGTLPKRAAKEPAAQEPAAQEPKLQAEQELALDCLDTEPEEPFGMTAQEFWKRWESETWYFDIHGNIVEKDTRRDRLRRGEEVEPEPKWDEWGALDEGDGYQQWADIQARRGRKVPLQKPAGLEPATKPKEES